MTAVEYFFNELQRMQYFIGNDMLEAYKQAKEMEKEQIKYAYDEGDIQLVNAEQYYNETFKSQNITLQNESESKVITELSDEEIKKIPLYKMINDTFKAGANWQQEQLKNR